MKKKSRASLFESLLGSLLGAIILAASSVYADCPENIVSLWALDEISGDFFEDAVDGNHGMGALSPAPGAGKVNGAQDFNGSDTGINVPANDSFNWADNASFSVEYWIKRMDAALISNEVVVGRDDGIVSDMHWWAGLWADGKAAFVLRGTNGKGLGSRETGEYLEGNSNLADGAWHHVAVVRDSASNENRLYVDGVLNDSATIAYDAGEGFGSETSDLNLGWLNLGSGYHFTGALDEVAIYDRVLLAEEILQHFNDGLSYCTPNTPPPGDAGDENGGGGGGSGGCFVNVSAY